MGIRRNSLHGRVWHVALSTAAAGFALSTPAAAQMAVRDFNIPAQNAASALQAFARQTGVQLLFPYDAAEARRTSPVTGRMRDAEALERLARAAGLTVDSYSASTAVLRPAPPSAPVSRRVRSPPPPAEPAQLVEPLVITGTNIRGRSSLGLHVSRLDRRDVEDSAAVSVQQLLASASPQLSGFGNAAQGGVSFEPRLRSLGGSSSASTLVLVNGHRVTPGGGIAFTSDPNVVPTSVVERIEIMSDGGSALYGSDAVAGVLNIVTRKSFDGLELGAQLGGGDSYGLRSADVLLGVSRRGGSLLLSYSYSWRDALAADARDFVSGNQSNAGPGASGRGGANFNTFACSPATVTPAQDQPGGGLVFLAPYRGEGLVNDATVNGQCSTVRQRDLLPEDSAHRLYLFASGEIGRATLVTATAVYSRRSTIAQTPRGALSNVAVWGAGAAGAEERANPFFDGPVGVNRATVSFDFQDMLGPGATIRNLQESMHAVLEARTRLPRRWSVDTTLTIGRPRYTSLTSGTICQPCAYQALNGSSLASGDLGANVQPTQLGDQVVVARPLTAANALDVWTAGGTRTSAAVREQLLSARTFTDETRPVLDGVVKLDGPLFQLPAGAVSGAAGAEYYRVRRQVSITTSGGATLVREANGSFQSHYEDRTVVSAFAELFLPLVSPEMGTPLVRRLELGLSGRIDHYSDIIEGAATTRNPKLNLGWEPARGLSVRATYGTSFTAPQPGHNQPSEPDTNFRDYFGSGGVAFRLPAGYPDAEKLGCRAGESCVITALSQVNGIVAYGANPELRPQSGRTWSLGVDLRSPRAPSDLYLSVTYWGARYRGLISNVNSVTQAAATPGLPEVFIIDPTPSQIARYTAGRAQVGPISMPVRFFYNQTQTNLFNLRGAGIDVEAGFAADFPVGRIGLDVTGVLKTSFERQIGAGPWQRALDIGNSGNTISPLKLAGRAVLHWTRGPLQASLSANYVGGYYLIDNTAAFAASPCPAKVTATGLGCQRVDSSFTVHLVGRARLGRGQSAPEAQLNVDNLFDSDPAWINSPDTFNASGTLTTWGNPVGRTVRVSIRKRW